MQYKFEVNFTYKDVQELRAKKFGLCDICGSEENNKQHAVDHDHKTGYIRGLLCAPCNMGL